MKAFETFVIYVTPFLILGIVVRAAMARYGVALDDVHEQAGSRRKPRRVFLLGSWRREH